MIGGASIRLRGIVAIAMIGTCGYALPSLAASSDAPIATPPGITLEPLGRGQGYGMEALLTEVPRTQITFADARGMTLYTYDKDSPGKSHCTGTCAKLWPAALASRSARPIADWKIIRREDGTRQWGYKDRPLYTFAQDVDAGSEYGVSPRNLRQFVGYLARQRAGTDHHPAGWSPALAFPVSGIPMPESVAIREVGDANGLAFVDQEGRTLYRFEGRGGAKALVRLASETQWTPLTAPALAHAVGDWSIIARGDGIRQWAYRGKPLFTFSGDLTPGDANGIGVSQDWDAALAVSLYMPLDVRLEQTLDRGKVLATAQGLTLYRRDGVALDTGGGQSLRHGVPIRPGIGRNIGITGCSDACLTQWHPFLAPANAQPDGFWDVALRPDGTRQWVYQGYPLYTFRDDKKPGDMNGNDIFNMVLSDNPNQVNSVGTPMHGTAGLYWTVAYPSG
jgi:predicted lipoprotein with Yx(FWY)xxD motif